MKKYVCMLCGHVYDEDYGYTDYGIKPGTLWADVPEDWVCPLCQVGKVHFEEQ